MLKQNSAPKPSSMRQFGISKRWISCNKQHPERTSVLAAVLTLLQA